jgi:hypothetical protein
MPRFAATAFLAFALAACAPSGPKPAPTPAPAAPPAPEILIACEGGAFTAATRRADLEARFGKQNVREAPFALGEGDATPGLVLFEGNPARTLEIQLAPDGKTIQAVRTPRAGGAVSDWRGPGGLKVGDTLTAVEGHNGRMFMMTGFEWDFGGMVTNWGSEGRLTVTQTGCSTEVGFASPAGADQEIVGNQVFSSQTKAIRTANPKVAWFGVIFPQAPAPNPKRK